MIHTIHITTFQGLDHQPHPDPTRATPPPHSSPDHDTTGGDRDRLGASSAPLDRRMADVAGGRGGRAMG